MSSAVYDHFVTVVLPAIFDAADLVFPEFNFRRWSDNKWIASGPKNEHGPLGVRHDRVAIVRMGGRTPSSIAVVDGDPVSYTCWVTGRSKPPTGDDFRAAVAELAKRAGVDPGPAEGGKPLNPAEHEELRAKLDAEAEQRAQAEKRRLATKRKAARALWARAVPDHPWISAYLGGRGIVVGALCRGGQGVGGTVATGIPKSLRLVEKCHHEDTRTKLPAIIAMVSVSRDMATVHRIYLDPADHTKKAPVEKAKKLYSSPVLHGRHGVVRIAPLGPTGELAVAEGIETALAIAAACPRIGVWATISAGGMERLDVPDDLVSDGRVRRVVFCADNDESGRGLEAAERGVERVRRMGLSAAIAMPEAREEQQEGGE